jgi:hypothetical protein
MADRFPRDLFKYISGNLRSKKFSLADTIYFMKNMAIDFSDMYFLNNQNQTRTSRKPNCNREWALINAK